MVRGTSMALIAQELRNVVGQMIDLLGYVARDRARIAQYSTSHLVKRTFIYQCQFMARLGIMEE
jgi:hypothetical protein